MVRGREMKRHLLPSDGHTRYQDCTLESQVFFAQGQPDWKLYHQVISVKEIGPSGNVSCW